MGASSTRIAGHPVVRFGAGDQPLVIIPGLSDALQGPELSRLARLLLAKYYMRAFTTDFDVYLVSRPRELPEEPSTRDLATGYAAVLTEIGPADVLGISMGGLIAQYLGIDHPDTIRNLVIALAGPKVSQSGESIIKEWIVGARRDQWTAVYRSIVDVTYASTIRRGLYRTLFSIPGLAKKPPYPMDFISSANACLHHDTTRVIDQIPARTLVLGGEHDALFDATELTTLGRQLPNGTSTILTGTGHGAFEEQRSKFTTEITAFLAPTTSDQ